jgi:hypothetical protein
MRNPPTYQEEKCEYYFDFGFIVGSVLTAITFGAVLLILHFAK